MTAKTLMKALKCMSLRSKCQIRNMNLRWRKSHKFMYLSQRYQ
jgi:hypothetical protein